MAEDRSDNSRWGTIFMGPTADRESTIDKVTDNQRRELWNRRTEAEYMDRVRARATLRVQTMLDQARTNAEVIRNTARQWAEKLKLECDAQLAQAEQIKAEAEHIRADAEVVHDAAYEEGYRQGIEQGLLEVEAHRQSLDDVTSTVLKTIAEQSATLFETWREELTALTRDAVEVMTGYILSSEQRKVLENLLHEALQHIEDRRQLVVRVNPAEHEAVASVLDAARERHPEIQRWEVTPDASVTIGGLILESTSGMVDNRVDVRKQAVEEILQHLTLPQGAAESLAEQSIGSVLENTGILALAEDAERRAAEAQAEAQAEAEAQAAEEARLAAEAQARAEAERLEYERLEQERLEQERLEQERLAAEAEAASLESAEVKADELPDTQESSEGSALSSEPEDLAAHLAEAELPEASDNTDLDSAQALEEELFADAEQPIHALEQGSAESAVSIDGLPEGASLADVEESLSTSRVDTALQGVTSSAEEDDIPLVQVTINDADPSLLEQMPADTTEVKHGI